MKEVVAELEASLHAKVTESPDALNTLHRWLLLHDLGEVQAERVVLSIGDHAG